MNYVIAFTDGKLSLCMAYKCLSDALAQSDLTKCCTLDLLRQRDCLRMLMAKAYMREKGYPLIEELYDDFADCYSVDVEGVKK